MEVVRQAASGKRWGITRAALVILVALVATIAAHVPAHAQEPTATPIGGPALTGRVTYWDLGLRLAYPAGWNAPQFSAGQVLVAAPSAVGPDSTLHGPVLALRLVDPVRDLNLPKDATFAQIAAGVSVAPGRTVAVTASGETTVAGLDAEYADILDGETGLAGQTVAFMMPDGRYGVLLAVAPLADWAEFAPTFSAIRESAARLRPGEYEAPEPGDEVTFAPGGVSLTLPSGWLAESMSSSARVFYDGDPDHGPYADGSGFANGPQLVILAQPRPETATDPGTLAEALAAVVGESAGDETGEIRVGGRPGAWRRTVDRTTGQIVTFIGFDVAGGAALNILRWTTPGILRDASQPVLDAILGSVR